MLREAADPLQPLLAVREPVGGAHSVDVRLSSAPGGFRSIGRTERPVFAQLLPHCLELWTRRPEGLFPCGVLVPPPKARSTDAPLRDFARVAPRAMGVARSRPPPSDVRPALCRLCPVHLQPQCKQ